MAENEGATPRKRSRPPSADNAAPPPASTPPAAARRKATAPASRAPTPVPVLVDEDTVRVIQPETDRLDLRGRAVGRVDASDLSVSMGAVGAARAVRSRSTRAPSAPPWPGGSS